MNQELINLLRKARTTKPDEFQMDKFIMYAEEVQFKINRMQSLIIDLQKTLITIQAGSNSMIVQCYADRKRLSI